MPEWHENDALFKKECSEGHQWERRTLEIVRKLGLRATDADEQAVRENFEDRHRFKGSSDLVIETHLSECKSRRERFTTPKDFPWQDPFVDTVSNWGNKPTPPQFVLCISRETEAIIVLSSCTKPQWGQVERFDSRRKINQFFYTAGRHLWMPVSLWADLLKQGYSDALYTEWLAEYHGRALDGAWDDPAVAML